MTGANMAAPELAAIDMEGITRGTFILRGALAAGAVYGAGAVGPFVGRALAQEAEADIEILNFALTLEFLEREFYERAVKEGRGLDRDVRALAEEIRDNEAEHVERLTETIVDIGGVATEEPSVDFGRAFSSPEAFLKLAGTLERTGVGAYNGAAPHIESKDVLAAAGSIVQVEARHVALIALKRGARITPSGAFDKPLDKEEVLQAVKPFVKA